MGKWKNPERKKIFLGNIWDYNRLSSFALVNYRCDTLKTTKSPSRYAKFAQQVHFSFINSILHAHRDRAKKTDVTGDLLPLGKVVISACFISEIWGASGTFQIDITLWNMKVFAQIWSHLKDKWWNLLLQSDNTS